MKIGESQRLILRTLEDQDINSMMDFWGNPEVMKYCHGSICEEEPIKRAITRYQNLQNTRNHSVYAVVLKDTGEVIGGCGFNTTEKDDEVELIYHFSKDHWGRGYATEAGKACIDYISANPKFQTVSASVYPENTDSEKVLKKLGFKYTGMKWFEDSKCDEPCYELNLNEYNTTRNSVEGGAAIPLQNTDQNPK